MYIEGKKVHSFTRIIFDKDIKPKADTSNVVILQTSVPVQPFTIPSLLPTTSSLSSSDFNITTHCPTLYNLILSFRTFFTAQKSILLVEIPADRLRIDKV